MDERKRAPLSHFDSYDDQDLRDLAWGEQKVSCERFAKVSEPPRYQDHSIRGDWTPDED